MKKILLVMNGLDLNMPAVDFACYIAKLSKSHLTGIFLEGDGGEKALVPAMPDEKTVEASIQRFREACVCRETLSRVHRDRGLPLSEVIGESRFADVIIIDPELSAWEPDRHTPGRFVKEILRSSECPVLIAPYSFDGIDELVFAYDGTASSVYAIKQFSQLFPELRTYKVIVFSVRSDDVGVIDDQFKMKEWLNAHFPEVEMALRKGDPANQLFGYLLEKKKAFVVMGAYGRNLLSRFVKPSEARLVVKTIDLPLFITHR
ncbi:MAG TPA: universal stress protein [Puia sp.]|nr:universal stress protein [Puia sp.]